jgi:ribosomal protein S26
MDQLKFNLSEIDLNKVLEELFKKEAISEILPLPEIGYQCIYCISSNVSVRIKRIEENLFEYLLEVE